MSLTPSANSLEDPLALPQTMPADAQSQSNTSQPKIFVERPKEPAKTNEKDEGEEKRFEQAENP